MNIRLALPLLLLMTSCAHYAPAPLVNNPGVLTPPVATVLQTQAGAVDRPWLQPTPIDLTAPLSLQGVSALVVVNNPDLMALRARANVADAQAFAAGLLPDPTFSIGADKVLSGPDTFLNIAGGLGLDLNALRSRAVTRLQARDQARQVRIDLAWAEWQTAGLARIQAVRVIGLTRIVELNRASAAATEEQRGRAARAAARGDISASDSESARIAAFDAADRLRTAQRDLLTARQELARLLGFPPASVLALAPTELPAMPPSAERLFALARDSRADLSALRAGYSAQEASVHKAVLDQFPSLNLTVTGNRDSAGNALFGPSVDFKLPLWNRNRGGIAIELATREALKSEYDVRLFQTRADIAAAWSGIALTRQQLAGAVAGLPTLERQAAVTDRAARRGDLSWAAAMSAAQQLRDRKLVISQAELAIQEQTIALELLSGEPIEGWK